MAKIVMRISDVAFGRLYRMMQKTSTPSPSSLSAREPVTAAAPAFASR